jgi:hypothetical protein
MPFLPSSDQVQIKTCGEPIQKQWRSYHKLPMFSRFCVIRQIAPGYMRAGTKSIAPRRNAH